MRTQKQLVYYQSILEVFQEPGCPFCRFLKEYQAARIQHHSEQDIHNLCNFHTWGLAAVQNALTAAQVFIHLVDESAPIFNEHATCDLCREVTAEEDRRIREFVGCIHRRDVSNWLRAAPVLCMPHGIKLRRQVQPVVAARIDAIIENCRRQLTQDLKSLRDKPEADRQGWGSLGRAAEFLVSQRGLHS
jgi:hypothetical protein